MQLALDFASAEAARDRALTLCAEKARIVDPQFIERASNHMLDYLKVHGTSSGELLTDACKLAGIRSSDDRHFGVVFRMLIKRNLIRWAGSCKRSKGHATQGGSRYVLVVGG